MVSSASGDHASVAEKGIPAETVNHEGEALARLGYEEVAKRDIGLFTILCTGWNICNAWAAIAATIAIAIASGGTVTIIYGIILVLFLGGCSAASLAELASVYPTAGGQYHWTSILAPQRFTRGLSYACGAANIFSWISVCAGVSIIVPQLILAMVIFYNPGYEPQPWHYFLLYQAANFAIAAYNIFMLKRTSWIQDFGFTLTTSSFVVMVITCLARSTNKQSSDFVWTVFINNSGWSSDGIVFLTGLVSPNYICAGIDGAIHLAEECSNASVAVPRALMATIGVAFLTSFVFAVSMTYSMADFDKVLGTATGVPIYEIWHQATRSEAAATVFMVLLLIAVLLSLNACQQTASRLTWAFARDNALVCSNFINRMHPTLHVPVWAILANCFVIFIIGCIYLGSSTAFNALIGTGLVLQQITFSIPIALVLYRKRASRWLPSDRKFNLGLFGWAANVVTCAFGILVLVFYDFPFVMPATSGNMNYTSAVLGCMAIFTGINWIFYARKKYHGPRIE
ncbi:conserved hypothetical protein [Uncinocarpus reesii 1704]|uniref:Choline transport protein n=1 Tax=Uncinocarpus reesii (strain UAMH 1704) TaxID=336963 RepID=C4JWZ4_UNCRE|nr:uncharacterized protein UREG_06167 [Uncinocarpus reesii 1704]EEP81302.1 conserved hypothetical protein [Uncinocarpus reesii 1704]